jgi:hypothetical protein
LSLKLAPERMASQEKLEETGYSENGGGIVSVVPEND